MVDCICILGDYPIYSVLDTNWGYWQIKIAEEDRVTLLENPAVSLKILKFQFFRNSLDYLVHVLLPGRIVITKNSTSVLPDYKFS